MVAHPPRMLEALWPRLAQGSTGEMLVEEWWQGECHPTLGSLLGPTAVPQVPRSPGLQMLQLHLEALTLLRLLVQRPLQLPRLVVGLIQLWEWDGTGLSAAAEGAELPTPTLSTSTSFPTSSSAWASSFFSSSTLRRSFFTSPSCCSTRRLAWASSAIFSWYCFFSLAWMCFRSASSCGGQGVEG